MRFLPFCPQSRETTDDSQEQQESFVGQYPTTECPTCGGEAALSCQGAKRPRPVELPKGKQVEQIDPGVELGKRQHERCGDGGAYSPTSEGSCEAPEGARQPDGRVLFWARRPMFEPYIGAESRNKRGGVRAQAAPPQGEYVPQLVDVDTNEKSGRKFPSPGCPVDAKGDNDREKGAGFGKTEEERLAFSGRETKNAFQFPNQASKNPEAKKFSSPRRLSLCLAFQLWRLLEQCFNLLGDLRGEVGFAREKFKGVAQEGDRLQGVSRFESFCAFDQGVYFGLVDEGSTIWARKQRGRQLSATDCAAHEIPNRQLLAWLRVDRADFKRSEYFGGERPVHLPSFPDPKADDAGQHRMDGCDDPDVNVQRTIDYFDTLSPRPDFIGLVESYFDKKYGGPRMDTGVEVARGLGRGVHPGRMSGAHLWPRGQIAYALITDMHLVEHEYFQLLNPDLVSEEGETTLKSHNKGLASMHFEFEGEEVCFVVGHLLPFESRFGEDPLNPKFREIWDDVDDRLHALLTETTFYGKRRPLILAIDANTEDLLHYLPKSAPYLRSLSDGVPTRPNGKSTDKIFVTSHFDLVGDVRIDAKANLSDHYPLVATLSFRRQRGRIFQIRRLVNQSRKRSVPLIPRSRDLFPGPRVSHYTPGVKPSLRSRYRILNACMKNPQLSLELLRALALSNCVFSQQRARSEDYTQVSTRLFLSFHRLLLDVQARPRPKYRGALLQALRNHWQDLRKLLAYNHPETIQVLPERDPEDADRFQPEDLERFTYLLERYFAEVSESEWLGTLDERLAALVGPDGRFDVSDCLENRPYYAELLKYPAADILLALAEVSRPSYMRFRNRPPKTEHHLRTYSRY